MNIIDVTKMLCLLTNGCRKLFLLPKEEYIGMRARMCVCVYVLVCGR